MSDSKRVEKIISFYKEKFPLLTLGIYIIGFIYFVVYYFRFDINIVTFASLTDILLSMLSFAVIVSLFLFIIDVCLRTLITIFIGSPTLKSYDNIKFDELSEPVKKEIGSSILQPFNNISLDWLSEPVKKSITQKHEKKMSKIKIVIGAIIALALWFTNIGYISIIMFMILLVLSMYNITKSSNKDIVYKEAVNILLLMLVLIITIFSAFTMSNDVVEKERDFYAKSIKFKVDGKNYSTMKNDTDRYNFIGETSNYIFLYDLKYKGSLIFQKSSLKGVEIYKRDLHFGF